MQVRLRILFTLVFSLYNIFLFAQDCIPIRYLDDMFVSDRTEDILFGEGPTVFPPLYAQSITLNEDLDFDIYQPVGDTLTKRPVIIMAFGGAFLAGWKQFPQLVDYCEAMCRKGYVVVSADYRLGFNPLDLGTAIRALYRGGQDMKACIRYIKAHADTYGIDTTQIYAGGHSAGAINAIHSAYVEEWERAAHPLMVETYEVNISGLPDWPDLGCIECGANDLGLPPYNHIGKPTAIINMWGAIADTLVIQATDNVPVISFHGTDDNTVNDEYGSPFDFPLIPAIYGSQPLHQHLDNLGILNELHLYQGEGHELWDDPALAQEIVDKSAAFLYHQILKPETPVFTGASTVCSFAITSYAVPPNTAAAYCWTVTNGTIISPTNDTHAIDVQWNENGTGVVELRIFSCHAAASDVASLAVTISPPTLPNDISFDESQVDQITVNWSPTTVTGETVEVFYLPSSSPTWATGYGTSGDLSFTFNGLTACTDQQVQVRATCGALVSDFSPIYTVHTACPRVYFKVFLEGAFDNGSLSTVLNDANLLPLTPPFSISPWNYTGTESMANFPPDAVDWLLVELRDATDNSIMIGQKAAILLSDGHVMDVDGNLGVAFDNLADGSYYILVRHRNHLDVISRAPISVPNINNPYDFTFGAAQAAGVNQQTQVAAGMYALYAGDITGDGVVSVQDFNAYAPQSSLLNGYYTADLNLNKNVTVQDFNLYQIYSSVIGESVVRY